ncbi:hypothetical protein [Azospirillum melinis]
MSNETPLTMAERDLIRREFMRRMTIARSIHNGFLLKRQVTRARKGEPKMSAAVQSMLDRGLVEVADLDAHWPTARFTSLGFEALRRMAGDRRALPEQDYAHLSAELAKLPESKGA